MNKELINYIKFFIQELNFKKKTADNETKRIIDTIIVDINNSVIPDVYKIVSEKFIIEYSQYIQEYALNNGITLPTFVDMEWMLLYRNNIINNIIE